MKQGLRLITSYIFLVVTLFSSCKKEDTINSGNLTDKSDNLVDQIAYHIKLAKQFLTTNSTTKNVILTRKARWDVAKVNVFSPKHSMITVPLGEEKIQSRDYKMFRQLVFYVDDDKISGANVIEIFLSLKSKKQIEDIVVDKALPVNLDGFDGMIIRYDLDYKTILGRSFKDGKKLEATGRRAKKNQGEAGSGSIKMDSEFSVQVNAMECWHYYWVTTNPDGSENWDYMYTTCTSQNEGLEPPDGGGGNENFVSACASDFESNVDASVVVSGDLRRSGPDFPTGPGKMERYWSWKFHKGLGWNIVMPLTGKLKATNDSSNPNEWRFEELIPGGGAVSGVQAGISVEYSLLSSVINPDPVASAISIRYNVTISVVCQGAPLKKSTPHNNQQIVHWNL